MAATACRQGIPTKSHQLHELALVARSTVNLSWLTIWVTSYSVSELRTATQYPLFSTSLFSLCRGLGITSPSYCSNFSFRVANLPMMYVLIHSNIVRIGLSLARRIVALKDSDRLSMRTSHLG